MPWLFEVPNRSENIFRSSQHRWTLKVPVVSTVLVRPSYSASFRKNFWNNLDFSVPGDALEDIETVRHPKMPSWSADDFGFDLGLLTS